MSTIHACWLPNSGGSDSVITRMLAASDYWSPDACSQYSNANNACTLAKASLFNTALSKLDHAYHDQQTGLTISAHARIDNRQALINTLKPQYQNTNTFSDGHLILHAYARWGEACPRYLLGDFVFIIWDEPQQKLFCARDHFGVKVLFYSQTEQGMMVSNEHKAFFTAQWLPKTIKEKWLVDRLWGLGPTAFESPCRDISVLPAAHTLTVDKGGARIRRYWQLEDKNDWQGLDDETLIAELSSRFQIAVARRLESDYPLGAELSEGLDSNGIVGYTAKILENQTLYTFSHQCEKLTETNQAIWGETYQDIFAMLSMHENLHPVWSDTDSSAALKNLDHEKELFYRHFGAVLNIHSQTFLRPALARKKHIRTLLSGWGGDHCVSSYGDFYENELFRRGQLLALYRLLIDKKKRGRGSEPWKAWVLLLIKHLCPLLYRYRFQYRGGLEAAMLDRARTHFLQDDYIHRYHCEQRLQHFIAHYRRPSVKSKEWMELFDIGVENRMVWEELAARQHRLEYRYPLLDVPLVEFSYNLPGHLKMYHGTERYAFRRILEGVTTQRIQWRRKADVAFPAQDLNQMQQERITQLRHSLSGSDLAQRYSTPQKLNRFFKSAVGPTLRNIELLADLEQYTQTEAMPIV